MDAKDQKAKWRDSSFEKCKFQTSGKMSILSVPGYNPYQKTEYQKLQLTFRPATIEIRGIVIAIAVGYPLLIIIHNHLFIRRENHSYIITQGQCHRGKSSTSRKQRRPILTKPLRCINVGLSRRRYDYRSKALRRMNK